MRSFQNKATLITGAASGIGREIAIQMGNEGARLGLLDRNAASLQKLSGELSTKGIENYPIVCDLGDQNSIASIKPEVDRHLGNLEILINNAGIGLHGPTHELTDDERNQILQINLNAPFQLFQLFIHELLNANGGHVVNVSSFLGLLPQEHTTAYSVSKYGLVGLTESLRAEYSRWGLGVTLICPGFVQTPLLDNLPSVSKNGQKLRKPPKWLTTTPQKIARQTIAAMKRNRRMVVSTPLAKFLHGAKRFLPGVFDFVQTFKSSKIKRLFGLGKSIARRDKVQNQSCNDSANSESPSSACQPNRPNAA